MDQAVVQTMADQTVANMGRTGIHLIMRAVNRITITTPIHLVTRAAEIMDQVPMIRDVALTDPMEMKGTIRMGTAEDTVLLMVQAATRE